jgi:isopentenyldiphosphate isomerase
MSSSPAEEIVAWVDDDDRVLAPVTRGEIRRRNLLHRAVYVFVWNRRGELLVHQRTWSKDLYPGYWDVCVGGVPRFDEGYDEAAQRELREELGIHRARVSYLFSFRYRDADSRVLGRAYRAVVDEPLEPQPEEILATSFLPLSQIERWLAEHQVCPDSRVAYALLTGER